MNRYKVFLDRVSYGYQWVTGDRYDLRESDSGRALTVYLSDAIVAEFVGVIGIVTNERDDG